MCAAMVLCASSNITFAPPAPRSRQVYSSCVYVSGTKFVSSTRRWYILPCALK